MLVAIDFVFEHLIRFEQAVFANHLLVVIVQYRIVVVFVKLVLSHLMFFVVVFFPVNSPIDFSWTMTLDHCLNMLCAALFSGLLGPRQHSAQALTDLKDAGVRASAREERDARQGIAMK